MADDKKDIEYRKYKRNVIILFSITILFTLIAGIMLINNIRASNIHNQATNYCMQYNDNSQVEINDNDFFCCYTCYKQTTSDLWTWINDVCYCNNEINQEYEKNFKDYDWVDTTRKW